MNTPARYYGTSKSKPSKLSIHSLNFSTILPKQLLISTHLLLGYPCPPLPHTHFHSYPTTTTLQLPLSNPPPSIRDIIAILRNSKFCQPKNVTFQHSSTHTSPSLLRLQTKSCKTLTPPHLNLSTSAKSLRQNPGSLPHRTTHMKSFTTNSQMRNAGPEQLPRGSSFAPNKPNVNKPKR